MSTLLRYLKTREVAALLQRSHYSVYMTVWRNKIPAPMKDCSGDLLWTPEDIERCRIALTTDGRGKGPTVREVAHVS